jgi:hypothetical protein
MPKSGSKQVDTPLSPRTTSQMLILATYSRNVVDSSTAQRNIFESFAYGCTCTGNNLPDIYQLEFLVNIKILFPDSHSRPAPQPEKWPQ